MATKTPTAPTKRIWLLGLALGILSILGHFGYINELNPYNYWMLLGGFTLLAIGTTFRGI